MPSIHIDPRRLPDRDEARALADQMEERAKNHPDGDENDYLIAHLLRAYSQGKLQKVRTKLSKGKPHD